MHTFLSPIQYISSYIAALSLVERKWNWRKWTRIRSFWLANYLRVKWHRRIDRREMHRSRRKGSCETARWKEKPEQSGQRKGVFRRKNAKRKEWQRKGQKEGRLSLNRSERLEMTRRDRKDPKSKRRLRGEGKKSILNWSTRMETCLLLSSFSFFLLILYKMSLNAFSWALSVYYECQRAKRRRMR